MDLPAQEVALVVEVMDGAMPDMEEETLVMAGEILALAVAMAAIHLTGPALDERTEPLHFAHTTTALARLIRVRNASTQPRSIWPAWRRSSRVANWHPVA
jgi:hypothetical protein